MPDVYGNPTPQEVQMLMRQQAQKQFLLAQQSQSPGVRAGASLGAIFGGTLKKTLDTRKAREAEVTRLMKNEGMSKEMAWDRARQTIGREHAEVRKARKLQDAASDVQEFIGSLPEEDDRGNPIPIDMRQAQGKLYLSSKLRGMGMTTEANNLATQAAQDMAAAEERYLNLQNLKARTNQTITQTAKTAEEIQYVGTTDHMKNVMQKEQIIARLATDESLTQQDREALMRAKGHLEAKLLKDETIVGRTEQDLRDPVLMRKLFTDLADNNVMVASIDEVMAHMDDLDNFEKTIWAGMAKDAIGFMESWFGRKPSESEAEFMARIQEKEAAPTRIAAMIRHALTGAQMSAFEIQYLTPFLPSPNDDVSEIKNKLRVVKAYTQLDSDVRLQMFLNGVDIGAWAGGGSAASPAKTDSDPAAPSSTLESIIESREANAS